MDAIAKDAAAKHSVKADVLQSCIAAQDQSKVLHRWRKANPWA